MNDAPHPKAEETAKRIAKLVEEGRDVREAARLSGLDSFACDVLGSMLSYTGPVERLKLLCEMLGAVIVVCKPLEDVPGALEPMVMLSPYPETWDIDVTLEGHVKPPDPESLM